MYFLDEHDLSQVQHRPTDISAKVRELTDFKRRAKGQATNRDHLLLTAASRRGLSSSSQVNPNMSVNAASISFGLGHPSTQQPYVLSDLYKMDESSVYVQLRSAYNHHKSQQAISGEKASSKSKTQNSKDASIKIGDNYYSLDNLYPGSNIGAERASRPAQALGGKPGQVISSKLSSVPLSPLDRAVVTLHPKVRAENPNYYKLAKPVPGMLNAPEKPTVVEESEGNAKGGGSKASALASAGIALARTGNAINFISIVREVASRQEALAEVTTKLSSSSYKKGSSVHPSLAMTAEQSEAMRARTTDELFPSTLVCRNWREGKLGKHVNDWEPREYHECCEGTYFDHVQMRETKAEKSRKLHVRKTAQINRLGGEEASDDDDGTSSSGGEDTQLRSFLTDVEESRLIAAAAETALGEAAPVGGEKSHFQLRTETDEPPPSPDNTFLELLTEAVGLEEGLRDQYLGLVLADEDQREAEKRQAEARKAANINGIDAETQEDSEVARLLKSVATTAQEEEERRRRDRAQLIILQAEQHQLEQITRTKSTALRKMNSFRPTGENLPDVSYLMGSLMRDASISMIVPNPGSPSPPSPHSMLGKAVAIIDSPSNPTGLSLAFDSSNNHHLEDHQTPGAEKTESTSSSPLAKSVKEPTQAEAIFARIEATPSASTFLDRVDELKKLASSERRQAIKVGALAHSEIEMIWSGALTACGVLRYVSSQSCQSNLCCFQDGLSMVPVTTGTGATPEENKDAPTRRPSGSILVPIASQSASSPQLTTEAVHSNNVPPQLLPTSGAQISASNDDAAVLSAITHEGPSSGAVNGHSNLRTALEASLPKCFAGKSGTWLRRTYYPLIHAHMIAEGYGSHGDDRFGFVSRHDESETSDLSFSKNKSRTFSAHDVDAVDSNALQSQQHLPHHVRVLNMLRLRQYVRQVKAYLNYDPLTAAAVQSGGRVYYVTEPHNDGDTSESSDSSMDEEAQTLRPTHYRPPTTHKQRLRNLIKERNGKAKVDADRFGIKRGQKMAGTAKPEVSSKLSVFDFTSTYQVAETLLAEVGLGMDAVLLPKDEASELSSLDASVAAQPLTNAELIAIAKSQAKRRTEAGSLLHIIFHHNQQQLQRHRGLTKEKDDSNLMGQVLSGAPIAEPGLNILEVPESKFRTSIWKDMNKKRRQKNVSDRREREGKEVFTERDGDGDLIDYNLNRRAQHQQHLSDLCVGEGSQNNNQTATPAAYTTPLYSRDARNLSHFEREVVFNRMPLNNETVTTYFSQPREGDTVRERATVGASAIGSRGKAAGGPNASLAQREIDQLAQRFTLNEINDEVWHGYSEGQNNKVMSKRVAMRSLDTWMQAQMRVNRRLAAPKALRDHADKERLSQRLQQKIPVQLQQHQTPPQQLGVPAVHNVNISQSRRTSVATSASPIPQQTTKGPHSEKGTSPSKAGDEHDRTTTTSRSNPRNDIIKPTAGNNNNTPPPDRSVPNIADVSGTARITAGEDRQYQAFLVKDNYSADRRINHHYRDRATLGDRAYVAKMIAESRATKEPTTVGTGDTSELATEADAPTTETDNKTHSNFRTLDRARRLAQSLPSERPNLRVLDKAGMAELLQSTTLAPSVLYRVSDEYRKDVSDIKGLRSAALTIERNTLSSQPANSNPGGWDGSDSSARPTHLKYGAIKRSCIPPRPSSVAALRAATATQSQPLAGSAPSHSQRPKTASSATTIIESINKEVRLASTSVTIGGTVFPYDPHFAPRGQATD